MKGHNYQSPNSEYHDRLNHYFKTGMGSGVEKLANFAKYVPRQNLTNFLAKYELFKKILNINGSIIECGVLFGGGLMTFAQLSSIFEPINYTRKIIGFDTFAGFPRLDQKDKGSSSTHAHKGGLAVDSFNDIRTSISLYDSNRMLSHIPKIELVRGNVSKTIPQYLKLNPHTVVSLLYLDFDIYEPTKIALKHFLPRMPKGSVIAFDELNSKDWVGETQAVMEEIGLNKLRIERFSFATYMSYAIIE